MDIRYLNKYNSPFTFHLTGSQYFGNNRPDSDFDYMTEYSPEVANWLRDNGFVMIYGGYTDQSIKCVYRNQLYHVDVQLIKTVEMLCKKVNVQKRFSQLGIKNPSVLLWDHYLMGHTCDIFDVRTVSQWIAEYYLAKFGHGQWAEKLAMLDIRKLECDQTAHKITITLTRVGQLIGTRNSNVVNLGNFMDDIYGKHVNIHMVEAQDSPYNHLVPMSSCY